jgi:WD40 repeat protein/serine/threonine protein kinase
LRSATISFQWRARAERGLATFFRSTASSRYNSAARFTSISNMADPPPSTSDAQTLAAGPSRAIATASDDHPNQIGPFRILAKIAEGGMGIVYKAEQLKPVRRVVALKVIKLGMDSREVVARFEAERQALAMMDHPNIAKVFDGGLTPSGQPYFVMELIDGPPLLTFCDNATLTSEQRLELFIPICHALQHAHQKGIIHRDLKPSNILVTLIDGKPEPKVIDFGVAKATGADGKLTESTLATQLGFVVGTLEYMSPEQAGVRGTGDIDTRADIYSLGVILYELVTGLRPLDTKRFQSAALAEMIRIVQEEEPSKPSTRLISHASLPALAALRKTQPSKLMALLRGELDWIVMKCLEKDRERRYATANALGRDIQRYLANEPVEARPPTARYRLRKFVTRHKRPVLAATLVMLALIGGTVGTTMGMLRANKAKQGETLRAQGEQAAKQDAFNALRVSRTLSARLAYERAQQLCEQDQVDLGMLWFGRALELAPEDAADLDRAVRTAMAAWSRGLYTIRMKLPHSWTTDQVKLSPDGRIAWTRERDGSARLDDATSGLPLVPNIRHRNAATKAATTMPNGFGVTNGYFNRDGSRLLSTGDDNTARLLDTATGRTLLAPPGQVVGGIGLGGALGGLLATTNQGSLYLWYTSTGHQHGEPIPLAKPIRQVGFDPKEQLLFVPMAGTIRFIDIASGQPTGPDIAQDGVVAAHCTSDGRTLIGSNEAGDTLWLWDLATRKPIGEPLKQSVRISRLSLSLDGKRLWTVDGERRLHCWDVAAGTQLGPPVPMPSADIGDFKLHPGGNFFLTGRQGYRLRIWDTTTARFLASPCSLWEGISAFTFNRDGQLLITGFAGGGQSIVWNVTPGLGPTSSLAHSGSVFCLRSDAVGATLITAATARTSPSCPSSVRLHDVLAGRPLGDPVDFPTPKLADRSELLEPAAAISASGKLAAASFGENTASLWHIDAGPATAKLLRHAGPVRDLAFSRDGVHLATASDDHTVRLWDAATGEPIGPPLQHTYSVKGVAFSPDGRKLLSWGGRPGSIYGETRLWDVPTCQPAGLAMTDSEHEVEDAAFSPDGTKFVTAAARVRVWDTRSGREIERPYPSAEHTVRHVEFNPAGGVILAVMFGRLARLLDVASGMPIGAPLLHDGDIADAAFGADGNLVATACYDGTARFWDAATGLPIGPPLKHDKPVSRLRFVCSGSKLLTGTEGGILLWDVPRPLEGSRKRLASWTQVATSYVLDAGGIPVPIGLTRKPAAGPAVFEDHWLERNRQLTEMGGPPAGLAHAP